MIRFFKRKDLTHCWLQWNCHILGIDFHIDTPKYRVIHQHVLQKHTWLCLHMYRCVYNKSGYFIKNALEFRDASTSGFNYGQPILRPFNKDVVWNHDNICENCKMLLIRLNCIEQEEGICLGSSRTVKALEWTIHKWVCVYIYMHICIDI